MRNNAEKAFANIDILIQQRFQEIPNQITLLNGATKHERGLLSHITELRKKSSDHDSLPREKKRLYHLNLVFSELQRATLHEEDYPRLKSAGLFDNLQKRISEFENMIADSRNFYNECATLFNDKLMLVPNRQIMTPFGLVKLELLGELDPITR